MLRDEDEAYARKLAQACVTAVRYNSTLHDFVMLNAVVNTPAAKRAMDQATTVLRKPFAGK